MRTWYHCLSPGPPCQLYIQPVALEYQLGVLMVCRVRWCLILVYTVCSNLFALILRQYTVNTNNCTWTTDRLYVCQSVQRLPHGPRQAKNCLQTYHCQTCAKCTDSVHPARAQSIIRPLLSIHTFCSIQWIYQRTVKALIRLRGCAGWSGPSLSACARRHIIAWRGQSILQIIRKDVVPGSAT